MSSALRRARRHAVYALILAFAPAVAEALPAAGASGLRSDPAAGLTWTADPLFLVGSGLARCLTLPRAEALRLIALMNEGGVENFGFDDWRLPTDSELRLMLADLEVTSDGSASDLLELHPRRSAGPPAANPAAARPAPQAVVWPVRGAAIPEGFPNVVVLGTNSVRLKNLAVVASGNVMANDASSGPTLGEGYELVLEPRATTPAGYSIAADSVRIKNNAVAGGDVAFNELVNQGAIGGSTSTPLALPVFALLPPFHAQAPLPGSPGISVADDGFVVLPAGDYGTVAVGARGTLVFAGGVYDLGSLTTREAARLLFAAASEVRVAGRLQTGARSLLGPEEGSGTAVHDLVLYVAGIDGANGVLGSTPRAVELGPSGRYEASVYAPNGTLRIDHDAMARGAFLARDVLVENAAELHLDSFFFNRPPRPGNDSLTVDEGATTTVLDSAASSLLANDSDPNGDTLSVDPTPVSAPAHGSLTLHADGTFSYAHDGSETTSDGFVYRVCDDGYPSLCATAAVGVTVRPVNDPPLAVADSATVEQGGAVTTLDSLATSLLANDSDAEGGQLAVTPTPVVAPAHGTLTLHADGTFLYQHDGGDSAADSFVYEVCDDGVPTGCATATVAIRVLSTVRITVVRFGLGDGKVVSSPAGIDCGAVCSAVFAPSGSIVLTPEPFGTSVFGGWSGDPDCDDGVVATDGDKLCFARFDASAVPAVLTVVLAGAGSGRVESAPAGIDCPGNCAGSYAIPSRVELTALAGPGSIFRGWSGADDCADGSLSLFSDTTCIATFDPAPPPPPSYALRVVVSGGLGTVTSNPSGLVCSGDCTVRFPQGASVTLFARPDEGTFAGWGGDCTGTAPSTVVTLDADKLCTATIQP